MWRPKDWPKSKCDTCKRKEEDSYGLYCDLACGEYTAWRNREWGADLLLGLVRQSGKQGFLDINGEFNESMLMTKVLPHGIQVFIPDDPKEEANSGH